MAGRKSAATTEPVANEKTLTESTPESKSKKAAPIVPKDVDPNTIVLVKNGFQGKLVYISPRTSERIVWEGFGDEQDMELRELRNAKSSAKKFFENNWFMFDDENAWVIPYLGLGKYYKYALKLEDFDSIFKMSPDKIAETVATLSKGQRNSLAYRSRELVMSKEIDSLKVIDALEKALGIDLIEK